MRAIDTLPTTSDFNKLPLELPASQLDSLRANWQIESLGMMLNYKMNWTEWHAIREFVQNALDATEAVSLLFEDQQNISYIADNGPGIILRHMFLGEQKGETEREIHCLRGRFGEGMKLALLPLMRAGNRIIIRTVGTDYHFSVVERADPKGAFHQINMFSCDNNITRGTVVAIENMSCLKYRNRFAPMIVEDSPQAVIVSVKGGPEEFDDCKVRQVFNLSGQIFVRDIYVMTSDALFGYNFWFDDTRKVLSTDRNEIRSMTYNVSGEFQYLLKANCAAFITLLFETLYSNETFFNPHSKKQFSKRESLEWYVLNEFNPHSSDNITAEDAATIATTIHSLLDQQDFSWSRNPREQKILEQFGIVDLRDKLPDLRQLLLKFNLVKDPKDLLRAAELTNETVVITVEDFKTAQLEGGIAEELANAVETILIQLHCIIREIRSLGSSEFEHVNLRLYAGNFKGTEERVSGYYQRDTNTVYVHTKNLMRFTDLMRVFIHEMSHAYCSDCIDVSIEFERAMQEIASHVIELVTLDRCSIPEMRNAVAIISDYKHEYEQVIQDKVAIVSNPYNLIRPEHVDSRDRDVLDQAFLQIARGAYADIEDVAPILQGYNPSSRMYDLEWNCRGRRSKREQAVTRSQILEHDIETLMKLKIDLPIKLGDMDADHIMRFFRGDYRAELRPELLVAGENWSDADTCLKFVLSHPSRWVKARNLDAYLSLINSFPDIENLSSEQRDVVRANYFRGDYADVEGLLKLRQAAPTILRLQHPAAPYAHDYYAYPMKEKLIEWAGNLGWKEVLVTALEVCHATNRRYAVYGLAKQTDISPVIDVLRKEIDPEVLVAALEVLKKRDRNLLHEILDQKLNFFREIATLVENDQASYYKQGLSNFLDSAIQAREMFQKYGQWPYSLDQ